MKSINRFKKYIIYIFIVISTITIFLYLGLGNKGIAQNSYSGVTSHEDSIIFENKESSRIISNESDQVEVGEIIKIHDLPPTGGPDADSYDTSQYYQSSIVDEENELIGVGGFEKIYWFDYELNLVKTWDYSGENIISDNDSMYRRAMIYSMYPDWEENTIYCAGRNRSIFSIDSETGKIKKRMIYNSNNGYYKYGSPDKIIDLNNGELAVLYAYSVGEPDYYGNYIQIINKDDLSQSDVFNVNEEISTGYRLIDMAVNGDDLIVSGYSKNLDDEINEVPGYKYISEFYVFDKNNLSNPQKIDKATYNIDGKDVEDNIYSAFNFVELEGETKYISVSRTGYLYYWDSNTNSVKTTIILDKETGQPIADKAVEPWGKGADSVKVLFEDDNVAYIFSGASNGWYFFHKFDKNTKQTYLLSEISGQVADWDNVDPDYGGDDQSIKSVASLANQEGKIISIGHEGGVALLSAIDKESFDIQMIKPEEYIDGYNPNEYQLIIETKYGLELDKNSTDAGITVYDTSKVDETSGEPTEKIDISFSEMEFISTEEEESNGKYIIEFSVEDIFEPGTEFAINSINIKDWVSFEDYNYYDLNGEYVESGNIKYTTAKSTMSISKIEPTSINVSVQYPADYSMLRPEEITFYNEVISPTPGYEKLESEFVNESGLPTVTPEGNYNYDFIINDLVPDTEYKIYYSFDEGVNYIYSGSEIMTAKLPLLFNEEVLVEQEGSNATLTFSIVDRPGSYAFNEDNVYLVNEKNESDRIKGTKVVDSSKSSTEYKYLFENIENKTYSLRIYNDDGIEITNPEQRLVVIEEVLPENSFPWLIVLIIIISIIVVSGGIFVTTKVILNKRNESK